MTTAQGFLDALLGHGCELVTGVPCSYFAGLIALLERQERLSYLPAANEGVALAIAAGATLGGSRAVVLAQNSGFGNLVNPLTSLVLPYRIPVLVVMSMRGWPEASAAEPQHHWMGKVVHGWLDSLDVPHWMLTADGPDLPELLARAAGALDAGRPVFVLVAKDTIGRATTDEAPLAVRNGAPRRDEVVRVVLDEAGDAHVLSTTGFLSRSLFNLGNRDRDFYMQGSMGHVAGFALGAALRRPDRRFVVLDGDGAALMHLGTLSTIGHAAPANLIHIVFDNGAYESTGAQATGASRTNLVAVAKACGYRHVDPVDTVAGLRPAWRAALAAEGPAMVVVRGAIGGTAGERASGNVPVDRIAARFAKSVGAAG
ncbi:MAG: phosphonopyruvate decarboxylase [Egibacteraceae bacterium]